MVISGAILLLALPEHPSHPLLQHVAGALLIFTGLGLARKKLYGLVLFYGFVTLFVAGCILGLMTGGRLLSAIAVWLIPAIFYYPERRREFRSGV